jgi:hypothetical protein
MTPSVIGWLIQESKRERKDITETLVDHISSNTTCKAILVQTESIDSSLGLATPPSVEDMMCLPITALSSV